MPNTTQPNKPAIAPPEAYAQGWADGYDAAIKDLFGTADPSVLLKPKT